MKNISQLSIKLKRGDIRDIAKATGFTENYVKYVLNPNDKRSNSLIIEAAQMIISNRETLINKISKSKKDVNKRPSFKKSLNKIKS